jgi:putative inorganic carbon (hco3(-)) transporter
MEETRVPEDLGRASVVRQQLPQMSEPVPTPGFWFALVLAYLAVDYTRPQDIVPGLTFLRPGLLLNLVLTGYLVFRARVSDWRNRQTTLVCLFVALLAVYIPFARNNYFAFGTWVTMLTLLPFVLSTVVCVDSVRRLRGLMAVGILSMLYIAQYAVRHAGVGSGNYFQDENDVSLYLDAWVPFCFYLSMAERSKVVKAVYAIALVLGVAAVVISRSRGGLVGLVAAGLVVWLFSNRKLVTTIVVGLSAVAVLTFAGDAYWARIATTKDTDKGTAAERIESWKSGWIMFKANPLGVGGNNFQVRFPEYQTDWFQKGMWGRVAHSIWFTLLPETGVVGVGIYILLLWRNIKDTLHLRRENRHARDPDRRYLNALSAAFLASLTGFFAAGCFISVLYYAHYWYLTAMIAAAARVSSRVAALDADTTTSV